MHRAHTLVQICWRDWYECCADQQSRATPLSELQSRISWTISTASTKYRCGIGCMCYSLVWCCAFNKQTKQVLKPGGLLIWIGYNPLQGAPAEFQKWLDDLDHKRLRKRSLATSEDSGRSAIQWLALPYSCTTIARSIFHQSLMVTKGFDQL